MSSRLRWAIPRPLQKPQRVPVSRLVGPVAFLEEEAPVHVLLAAQGFDDTAAQHEWFYDHQNFQSSYDDTYVAVFNPPAVAIAAELAVIQYQPDVVPPEELTWDLAEHQSDYDEALAVFFAPEVSCYDDEVLADTPVGYWKLDETGGTNAADSSGNGNDGTYTNTPTLAQTALAAGLGTSVKFDSVSGLDSVNVPNDATISLAGNFTIEGWFKIPAGGSAIPFIIAGVYTGDDVNYYLGGSNGGASGLQPAVGFYNSAVGHVTATDDTSLSADTTYHIVGVFDNDNDEFLIYINGSEVHVEFEANGVAAETDGLYIGRRWDNALGSPDGFISNVALYDYALGSDRVAAHYNSGITPCDVETPFAAFELPVYPDFDWAPFEFESHVSATDTSFINDGPLVPIELVRATEVNRDPEWEYPELWHDFYSPLPEGNEVFIVNNQPSDAVVQAAHQTHDHLDAFWYPDPELERVTSYEAPETLFNDGPVVSAALVAALDWNQDPWWVYPDDVHDFYSPEVETAWYHLQQQVLHVDASILGLSDTDPVSTWPDLSGSGDLTQTGAARPTFRTAQSPTGLSVVRFDGTDDFIGRSGGTRLQGEDRPMTVMAALKVAGGAGTNRTVFALADPSNNSELLRFDATNSEVWSENIRDDAAASKQGTAGTVDNTWHVVTFVTTGTAVSFFLDGSPIGTPLQDVDVGFASFTSVALGALFRATPAAFFNGDMGEVYAWDYALSTVERESFEDLLIEKWLLGDETAQAAQPIGYEDPVHLWADDLHDWSTPSPDSAIEAFLAPVAPADEYITSLYEAVQLDHSTDLDAWDFSTPSPDGTWEVLVAGEAEPLASIVAGGDRNQDPTWLYEDDLHDFWTPNHDGSIEAYIAGPPAFIPDELIAGLYEAVQVDHWQELDDWQPDPGIASHDHSPITNADVAMRQAIDTFTRANSSSLGITEVGAFPWDESFGDWEIDTNQLEATGSVAPDTNVIIDMRYADHVAAFDLNHASIQQHVMVRGSNNSNFIIAGFQAGSNDLTMFKRVNHTYTQVGGPVAMGAHGGRVQLWAEGNKVTVYVNDVPKIEYTITDSILLTGTRIGVLVGGGGAPFDNLNASSVQWIVQSAQPAGYEDPTHLWPDDTFDWSTPSPDGSIEAYLAPPLFITDELIPPLYEVPQVDHSTELDTWDHSTPSPDGTWEVLTAGEAEPLASYTAAGDRDQNPTWVYEEDLHDFHSQMLDGALDAHIAGPPTFIPNELIPSLYEVPQVDHSTELDLWDFSTPSPDGVWETLTAGEAEPLASLVAGGDRNQDPTWLYEDDLRDLATPVHDGSIEAFIAGPPTVIPDELISTLYDTRDGQFPEYPPDDPTNWQTWLDAAVEVITVGQPAPTEVVLAASYVGPWDEHPLAEVLEPPVTDVSAEVYITTIVVGEAIEVLIAASDFGQISEYPDVTFDTDLAWNTALVTLPTPLGGNKGSAEIVDSTGQAMVVDYLIGPAAESLEDQSERAY